jgi:hypothetical protein
MWEKLAGWLQFLWNSGQEVKDNSSAIRELRQNDLELYEALRSLAMQNELLRKDNEALRQALHHERELREGEMRELKLELRLQIAEELRRLPPGEEK